MWGMVVVHFCPVDGLTGYTVERTEKAESVTDVVTLEEMKTETQSIERAAVDLASGHS
jgi:hypothetical protein